MDLKLMLSFLYLPLAWGSAFIFIKIGLAHWSPFLLMSGRQTLAGLLMLLVAVALRRSWPTTWQGLWPALAFGIFNGAAQGLMSLSASYVPAGQTALAVATFPFWMALLAWLTLRERVSGRTAAALALGLVGVWLALSNKMAGPEAVAAPFPFFGQVVGVAGAVFYAFAFMVSRRWFSGDVVVNTSIHHLVGGIGLLGVSAWVEGPIALPVLTFEAVWPIAVLAVGPSAIAFALQVYVSRRMTSAIFGYVTMLNAAVAVPLGALILGEELNPVIVTGVALVLCGFGLTQIRGGGAPAPDARQPGPLRTAAPSTR